MSYEIPESGFSDLIRDQDEEYAQNNNQNDCQSDQSNVQFLEEQQYMNPSYNDDSLEDILQQQEEISEEMPEEILDFDEIVKNGQDWKDNRKGNIYENLFPLTMKGSCDPRATLISSCKQNQNGNGNGRKSVNVLQRDQKNTKNTFNFYVFGSLNSKIPRFEEAFLNMGESLKKTLRFEIVTKKEFARLEVGVFDYDQQVELYYQNKFKIINQLNQQIEEKNIMDDDFIFTHNSQFQLTIQRNNKIILTNLNTKNFETLQYQPPNEQIPKLLVFMRLFSFDDQVNISSDIIPLNYV